MSSPMNIKAVRICHTAISACTESCVFAKKRSKASTSDAPSQASYLPVELVFYIAHLFEAVARRDDAYLSDQATRRGLSACALACREWCTRFQPLLFQRLRVSSLDDVQTLATLVRIHPTLGRCVDTLVVVEDQAPHAHMLILLLTSRLPSLSSLTVQVVGDARGSIAPFQHPPILASLSGFQGVKNLTLESCRLSSFKSLSRVVSAFPKLVSLICRGVNWDVNPPTGSDGLIIPTGICTASDTLESIKIEDCPHYNLFLLLLCAASGWSSCSKRGLFTRKEGPVVGRLVDMFAPSGLNGMICLRNQYYTESGYLNVRLAGRELSMRYGSPHERPCTYGIQRIWFSVDAHEPETQFHSSFMSPKETTSLLTQLQDLDYVEYHNEHIHLRPRDMSLFHNLAAALPGAHVIFEGLDDVTDRPYRLDSRRKVQPEFHCAVDVQPFGVAGLVIPQRVCGYFRTSRRTVNSTIVFPGGIRLHHALDGRYDSSPEYASHPAAVEDHYELGMKSALRLLWPGYPPWFYLFYAHEPNQPVVRSTSRLGAIARRVAWAIVKFLKAMKSRPTNGDWNVNNIAIEKIILVELRHVGRASWQPLLVYEA